MKKLMKKAMLAVLVIAAAATIQTTEAQAAKKPGQVKNIEETKKTSASFTFKFKKAKNAKKYQVRVYEVKGVKKSVYIGRGKKSSVIEWQATNKLVKKAECSTNKCTITGLESKLYAVKVRACNGNKYGKWATQFITPAYKGMTFPGKSSATGKLLKTEYNKWKKRLMKDMKEDKVETDDGLLEWIGDQFGYFHLIQCIKVHEGYVADPNKYTAKELYQTYKTGMGSELDIYHVIMDIYKDLGVPCTIERECMQHPDTGQLEYFYSLVDTKNNMRLSISNKHSICGG